MPWIIFWHGNCGSRIDSFDIVYSYLPQGMSVITFDFAGCGMSDGNNISLGYYESQDIGSVVNYCRHEL